MLVMQQYDRLSILFDGKEWLVMKSIEDIQNFNINNIKGKILFSKETMYDKSITPDCHGTIIFDGDINSIPWAFDGDLINGKLSFWESAFKYSICDKNWVLNNLQDKIMQIIYILHYKSSK